MYWNFGGNFKPVAIACQYSEWTKCFTSFINYIWFEVVTDVADCLANEVILWMVLAVSLIFVTTGYFVYWKSQWTREVERNQEKFIAVNHKMQDLELKVNIITYKTQYGIWPLQYLQEKNTLANIKNFRFGLSKFTLNNAWIENLLTRANEKTFCLEKYSNMQRHIAQNCSRIDVPNFQSPDDDNELLNGTRKDAEFSRNLEYQNNIDDKFGEPLQYIDGNRYNPVIVPPESNLCDRSKNQVLYIKENVGAHKNLSRRKSIALDNAVFVPQNTVSNKDLKVITSTANVTVYSRAISKNIQCLSKSHDTLLDVQERLTTLYKTIRNYNKNNSLIPMLKLDSDSNSVRTSDVVSCTMDVSTENKYALNGLSKFSEHVDSQNNGDYSNGTTVVTRDLKLLDEIKSANDDNNANRCYTEETCDNALKFITKTKKNPKVFYKQTDNIDTRNQLMEFQSTMLTDSMNMLKDELEPIQEIEPLYDLTTALLKEALMFKKQILSNVESQNNGIKIKEENITSCSETNNDLSLKQTNTFESKVLDMITEESSVSSSTEKKCHNYGYKTEEKNEISEDKTAILLNERAKQSYLKTSSSKFEVFTDEKVKKQKDVICLSKINNKFFKSEPSSNRIFPSSFSTIVICNDQDNTDYCKQTDDNDITLEIKSSQDLTSITESSSDVSVNRLIKKLLKNGRKSRKPNRLFETDKTATNGLMQNLTNDLNLTNLLTEPKNPVVNYDDSILHQSKSKVAINEEAKSTDMFNEDTTEIERLKEIKNMAKKFIVSVSDIELNEDNSLESKTCSDNFFESSSILKIQNSEIENVNELFLKNKINISTDKSGVYSDNSANEIFNTKQCHATQKLSEKCNSHCTKWKPSKAKSNSDLLAVNKRQLKLTHRRSKSYVNPRRIVDESECDIKKKHILESFLPSNKMMTIQIFNKEENCNNGVDIKSNSSSESLCSKTSSDSTQKSILMKSKIALEKNYSSPVVTNLNKKKYIKQQRSLELIPLVTDSSSKSCIPIMINRISTKENLEESHLCNKDRNLIHQVSADANEIYSRTITEDKAFSEKFTNFSALKSLRKVEPNAMAYYDSEDLLIANDNNQSDPPDTPVEELIVTNNLSHSRPINAATFIPETINGSMSCVLSDELSELNSLNSFIFPNPITSISPYKIERKETEVLVKPSTLDISTSMTNLPCLYHFEESNNINDLKIFEISDELTKEECIRYLQMFDQDSNCDQSTNTHDFCKLLEDV